MVRRPSGLRVLTVTPTGRAVLAGLFNVWSAQIDVREASVPQVNAMRGTVRCRRHAHFKGVGVNRRRCGRWRTPIERLADARAHDSSSLAGNYQADQALRVPRGDGRCGRRSNHVTMLTHLSLDAGSRPLMSLRHHRLRRGREGARSSVRPASSAVRHGDHPVA